MGYSSFQCKCGKLYKINICSNRCFHSLKHFEEYAKTLHHTLRNNRVKCGVPSDLTNSPSVAAPTKSLRHGEDQRRVESAKSLSYGEILPKPNPEDVTFWSTKTLWVNRIQFGTIFFLQVFWPVCNFVRR